jgi:hypothetical protein
MTKQQYNSFDDWWNEIENFSLRSERFFESMTQFSATGKPVNMELWLRAAFDAARAQQEEPTCEPAHTSERHKSCLPTNPVRSRFASFVTDIYTSVRKVFTALRQLFFGDFSGG